MIKLLLDQGLPRSAAAKLEEKGWDIAHVYDVGLSTAADSRIIEYARRERRTIVTLDADFHALLAISAARHPSVIRIRKEGLQGPELADLVDRVLVHVKQSLEAGAMVAVTEYAIRVHSLPVSRNHRL